MNSMNRMDSEFVVKRVRRRRRRLKGTPCVPENVQEPVNISQVNKLPEYLMDPPETPSSVQDKLQGNHTPELVCSFRVAKEVLGSSFRPNESNLAVGNIRV
jgi:hypothetical protein